MCYMWPEGGARGNVRRRKRKRKRRYLLAGWWEFVGLSCQVGQILQNSLQVSHFTQHVDLMVLHTHTHTIMISVSIVVPTVCAGGSITHTLTRTGFSMLTKLQ